MFDLDLNHTQLKALHTYNQERQLLLRKHQKYTVLILLTGVMALLGFLGVFCIPQGKHLILEAPAVYPLPGVLAFYAVLLLNIVVAVSYFQGLSLPDELSQASKGLKLQEALTSHLKRQVFSSQDQVFGMGDYRLVHQDLHLNRLGGFVLYGQWLTESQKLVETQLWYGEKSEGMALWVKVELCDPSRQRHLLRSNDVVYRSVYGEPGRVL